MHKYLQWLNLITVEPVMFFYMFAFMFTSVVEQSFYVYKACRADMGYTDEICLNLDQDNYTEENKKIQVVVSDFHQYDDIASHAIPIILALVLGSWSDRRGRKLPLLFGLAGKLYYVIILIISATQETWILNIIVYSASLPAAFTGSDLAIFMASFSYLADVTTQENKTLRFGILDMVYLATMPSGIALGKYIFNLTNQSYVIMFTINACMLGVAIIYTFLRLKWYSTPNQTMVLRTGNWFTDLFDKDHIVYSVKTVVRKRPGHRRTYLIMLFVSMAFYTFQRDESGMSYLYTTLKFKWTANEYSDYRTFQSAAYVIGTLIGVPVMTKVLGMKDTLMVMVGAACHAAARVIFALAEVTWLFYLGGGIVSLGPIAAPVIRSMTSKIVPVAERGKVFAVLSAADMAVPLFSGVIYTQVYNATIDTVPSAIYWVTVSSQVIVFLLSLFIYVSLGGETLQVPATETSLLDKCADNVKTEDPSAASADENISA